MYFWDVKDKSKKIKVSLVEILATLPPPVKYKVQSSKEKVQSFEV